MMVSRARRTRLCSSLQMLCLHEVARRPPISFVANPHLTSSSCCQHPLLVMDTKSQQPKGGASTRSALSMAIDAMNLAKEISSATPAKAVFGSVSVLLTMIRVRLLLP